MIVNTSDCVQFSSSEPSNFSPYGVTLKLTTQTLMKTIKQAGHKRENTP